MVRFGVSEIALIPSLNCMYNAKGKAPCCIFGWNPFRDIRVRPCPENGAEHGYRVIYVNSLSRLLFPSVCCPYCSFHSGIAGGWPRVNFNEV
jgi:hypothetical protein